MHGLQPFGEYAQWHAQINVVLAGSLFRENGVYYVMPKIGVNPLAKLFRGKVLKAFIRVELIDD